MDTIKVGVQNTGTLTDQKIRELEFDSKISDKKRDVEKINKEIGNKAYEIYSKNSQEFSVEVIDLCAKIKTLNADIEKLESDKKEMIDKCHNERESRRQEADKQ